MSKVTFEQKEIGGRYFANIPLDILTVPSYQRKKGTVNKLKNWKTPLCDTIKISCRDGKYFVWDGQHRVDRAKELGEKTLVAELFFGMTEREESDLFAEQTLGVERISTYDTFNANIVGEHEYALKLVSIFNKYNLTVNKSEKGKKIYIKGRNPILSDAKLKPSCEGVEFLFRFMKENSWLSNVDTASFEVFIVENILYAYNMFNDKVNNLSSILLEKYKMTPSDLKKYLNCKYPCMDKRTALRKDINDFMRGLTK